MGAPVYWDEESFIRQLQCIIAAIAHLRDMKLHRVQQYRVVCGLCRSNLCERCHQLTCYTLATEFLRIADLVSEHFTLQKQDYQWWRSYTGTKYLLEESGLTHMSVSADELDYVAADAEVLYENLRQRMYKLI